MKTLILKLSFIALVIIFQGCKKDNKYEDPRAKYPKSVTIEYIVTSTEQDVTANINYSNATGGSTDIIDEQLPFSLIIDRKVEFADVVSLYASTIYASDISLIIKINGKIVDSKSYESSGYAAGTLYYMFD